MNPQIPVILLDPSSTSAFSLFNANDWGSKSKQVIQSCAANYSVLTYALAKIEAMFSRASILCQPRYQDLVKQWKTAKWDLSSCVYLVDIPEAHLIIHGFLSTAKTFLDVFVQLFHSEGVVTSPIHGFHKKGDDVGRTVLHMLSHNAAKSKKDVAILIHDLICEHKKRWIDHMVDVRDAFIHPEGGLTKVMFALDLQEIGGSLVLGDILKPSLDNEAFDVYARKTLSKVDEFSKKCIQHLKSA
jgi:hypothetical protein